MDTLARLTLRLRPSRNEYTVEELFCRGMPEDICSTIDATSVREKGRWDGVLLGWVDPSKGRVLSWGKVK